MKLALPVTYRAEFKKAK